MILKPNQVCPYKDNCKYNDRNNSCQGTNPNRNNSFNCIFMSESGNIIGEGNVRSKYDVTGKMEFIQE